MFNDIGKPKNFLVILISGLLIAAILGAILGHFSIKREGYYYKVGKAHQFMPGWISNPEDSVVECEKCDKKQGCYNY